MLRVPKFHARVPETRVERRGDLRAAHGKRAQLSHLPQSDGGDAPAYRSGDVRRVSQRVYCELRAYAAGALDAWANGGARRGRVGYLAVLNSNFGSSSSFRSLKRTSIGPPECN